ncbi:hypothetical protein [Paraburkholderia sp. BL25I1N1]|uniref:hypothetical protein n=1 Tax=Paraburkholderia sp. BL25I1N1 TaxID=1938804 RepID=UPI000D07D2F0|nr:hypothetical protein [Paraburkholderia sp. BL25I1N1]PRY04094.1 hypothetical protein B0G73_11383 [Paraburkholderia sp. BL25I1N1]
MPMTRSPDIPGVTEADYTLLVEALSSLLRERSSALQIAAEVAKKRGLAAPNVWDFGLPDILRLRRVWEVASRTSA